MQKLELAVSSSFYVVLTLYQGRSKRCLEDQTPFRLFIFFCYKLAEQSVDKAG